MVSSQFENVSRRKGMVNKGSNSITRRVFLKRIGLLGTLAALSGCGPSEATKAAFRYWSSGYKQNILDLEKEVEGILNKALNERLKEGKVGTASRELTKDALQKLDLLEARLRDLYNGQSIEVRSALEESNKLHRAAALSEEIIYSPIYTMRGSAYWLMDDVENAEKYYSDVLRVSGGYNGIIKQIKEVLTLNTLTFNIYKAIGIQDAAIGLLSTYLWTGDKDKVRQIADILPVYTYAVQLFGFTVVKDKFSFRDKYGLIVKVGRSLLKALGLRTRASIETSKYAERYLGRDLDVFYEGDSGSKKIKIDSMPALPMIVLPSLSMFPYAITYTTWYAKVKEILDARGIRDNRDERYVGIGVLVNSKKGSVIPLTTVVNRAGSSISRRELLK